MLVYIAEAEAGTSMLVYALLIMGGLGLLLGMLLVIAEKFLSVKVDPRFEKVMELLPQVNCGACGYSGCSGYADALVAGTEIDFSKCAPGGPDIVEDIEAAIKDIEITNNDEDTVPTKNGLDNKKISPKFLKKLNLYKKSFKDMSKIKYATIMCNGGTRAVDRFEYKGVQSCMAADVMYGGQKACTFGCLGFGDCANACPFNAITISKEDNLPKVDKALCTGCGICVDTCPKNIIKLMPATTTMIVACSNTEIGGHVKKNCEVACIACKRCVKANEEGAFKVENNLAGIDQLKLKDGSASMKSCPTHAIMLAHSPENVKVDADSKVFSI